MTATPTVWISAVETSADMHGARVMRSLQARYPGLRFRGVGGPAMRRAGLDAVARAEDLSVMGLTEVLEFLPRILKILRRVKRELAATAPVAVVCIDAPDFHFPVAKRAARLKLPVVYYVAPQAWAWRKNRVTFLRRYVDRLMCLLPFEESFFRGYGVNARFAGHPLLEDMAEHNAAPGHPESAVLAILPGSRHKEIHSLLPPFLDTVRRLHHAHPDLSCRLIQAPGIASEALLEHWPESVPVELVPAEARWAALSTATVALAASGTATLECALLGLPTVVAYKVSQVSYAIGKRLVDVPYISLPNLIMDKPLFPEFLQDDVCADQLSQALEQWLISPEDRLQTRSELQGLRHRLGGRTASEEVAEAVLEVAGLATPRTTHPS